MALGVRPQPWTVRVTFKHDEIWTNMGTNGDKIDRSAGERMFDYIGNLSPKMSKNIQNQNWVKCPNIYDTYVYIDIIGKIGQ